MRLAADTLVKELSTALDSELARQVVEAYVDQERRFLAGDHGPAELNGGRLCEAVARCLIQLDTGRITHNGLPYELTDKLIDKDNKQQHKLNSGDRRHISAALRLVYKFRSQRGAVHITREYSANFMDSMLVIHVGKWIFADLLRLALKRDRETVATTIAQLVQLEHAIVHDLEGAPLVLVKGISAPDEILLLLNHADGKQTSKADLRRFAKQKPATVSMAITRLLADKDIRAAGADGTDVALTPKGEKRVIEMLMPRYVRAV